jgi:hypothetical protein
MNEDDLLSVNLPDNMSYTITNSSGTIDTLTINSSYNWNDVSLTSATCWDPAVKLDKEGIEIQESADLRIGNRSLKDFMDRVEERLNILHPNPALENRWNELAELGKRYRELEAEILEKEKMWKILKDE